MLKIGEIAGLCGISIKALRHYNKIGLFKPEYVDKLTKYRYYSEEQVKKLNLIMDLRDIGFSLKEIMLVAGTGLDKQALLYLLNEKRKESEDKIKLEEIKINNINSIAERVEKETGTKIQTDEAQEKFDERLGRLVTVDSVDSSGRHSIEEAIWL